MKEIKLIAFDLDGTLLDSRKCLSAANRNALLKCMEQGIEIVPCTGRIWSGVPEFIRNFPGIRYAITVNGAVIEDIREQRVLDERKMSWEKAIEILELADHFRTMYDVYAGGKGYGEARFMNNMADYGISPEIQTMIRATRSIVPDLLEEVRRLARPVEKINYFFNDSQERKRAREALLARGDVIVSASFPNNLEINAPGAEKGEALLRLAAYIGISPEQTMGFGDGENDMTLIQKAGIGVAMENATAELKEKADYVTTGNDSDGVAAAIEYLL